MSAKLRKILALVLTLSLLFQQVGFAQIAAELNISSHISRMAGNLMAEKFRPAHLRYFSYDSLNDNFKVLLDKGDLKDSKDKELQNSTQTLLSYFLVGLALPDSMFWVNLRPDSEDQVIDQYLEKTDVGRILLEADLQLKKDTAAMTSPATPEGKEYWDKLYKKASELYGYDNVSIPTLTRPWIVPGEIIVRESKDSAYVYKANLKVMLEQDYLKDSATYNFKDERSRALNEYSSELIRQLIIPRLTKEVNSSKRYAPLRQVYYSLILSRWFKLRFTGKTGTYASLINSRDLTNLLSKESWSKTEYFKQYQKSFSQGEYNIQQPVRTPTGQVIRSYFSGGLDLKGTAAGSINNPSGFSSSPISPKFLNSGVLLTGNSKRLDIVSSSPVTSEIKERVNLLSGATQDRVVRVYREKSGNLIETAKAVGLNLDIVEAYIKDANRHKGANRKVSSSSPVKPLRDPDFSIHLKEGIGASQLRDAANILKYRKGTVRSDRWLDEAQSRRQIVYTSLWQIEVDKNTAQVTLLDDQGREVIGIVYTKRDVRNKAIDEDIDTVIKLKEEWLSEDLLKAVTKASVKLPLGSLSSSPLQVQAAENDPVLRKQQITGLLEELRKEKEQPGSGVLPYIAVISDYHGEIRGFLDFVADAIFEKTGKKVKLDSQNFPAVSLREQLEKQGVNIKEAGVTYYLLGDFLDRGEYGLKCFRAAEELINLGVARYVTGNHDLWAFLNLMGYHLPVYKGYNFYGHRQSEELVKKHWDDPEIAKDRIGFWTEKLADYNQAQQELQDGVLRIDNSEEAIADIRKRIKEFYLSVKDQLNKQEKELLEDLAGFYFGKTDVSTGFNAVGMMSVQWWQEKSALLDSIVIEASAKGQTHEVIMWEMIEERTKAAYQLANIRLQEALRDGQWWWQVFNDINHQNYDSVEWWAKDWSSHKGWGTSVIDELNKLEGSKKWNQRNYINNKTLQDLRIFYRKQFNLALTDPFGSRAIHGWPPVEEESGRISFAYRGVRYSGDAIWQGFAIIRGDVSNLNTPLSELHEALSLVNSWYADKTTRAKPANVKNNIHKIGLEKIYSQAGIKTLFSSHNPLNTLDGVDFLVRQGSYTHVSVDKGMSWEKFNDLGGYVLIANTGIKLRGYDSLEFDRIIDNPDTIKLEKGPDKRYYFKKTWSNEPLGSGEFISLMENQLRAELASLGGSADNLSSSPVEEEIEGQIKDSSSVEYFLPFFPVSLLRKYPYSIYDKDVLDLIASRPEFRASGIEHPEIQEFIDWLYAEFFRPAIALEKREFGSMPLEEALRYLLPLPEPLEEIKLYAGSHREDFIRELKDAVASSPVQIQNRRPLTISEQDVRRLIGVLASGENRLAVKGRAANDLQRVRDPKNIGILKQELLNNANADLRISLSWVLGAIGNEYAVEALMEAITSRSFERNLAPAEAGIIDERPASVLFWIIVSLGQAKSPKAADLLNEIKEGYAYASSLPYKTKGSINIVSIKRAAKTALDKISNTSSTSSPVQAVKAITMHWEKEDKISSNLRVEIEDALRFKLNMLLS
ncbi:MAG: metallophosphoesterase, partial [Candidatus Omnitrophota bacterium]